MITVVPFGLGIYESIPSGTSGEGQILEKLDGRKDELVSTGLDGGSEYLGLKPYSSTDFLCACGQITYSGYNGDNISSYPHPL